jgi:riboflavin biosynthesis pyrimidine reductase
MSVTVRPARAEDGPVLREIERLAGRRFRDVGLPGCTVIRWLLDNDLVDEMNLLIFPVVVGQGRRLFPDTGSDRALHLVGSRATPKGLTIQVYRPSGRPQYATATADLKHVR